MKMFYLAGVSVSFFLTVLMVGKKNKSAADIILAFWLFFIGLHLFQYYLIITEQIFDYPSLLGLNIPHTLLHGPFLFLYISALTQTKPVNIFSRLLHFIPFVGFLILLIPFSILPAASKKEIFINHGTGYEWYVISANVATTFSGITYIIASLLKLRSYKKRIENEFSNTEQINLNWLRYMIYGITLIWVWVIVGNDTLIFGTAVLFVSLLGYFGIRQMGIFTNHHSVQNLLSPNFQNPVSINSEPEVPEIAETFVVDNSEAGISSPLKTKYERSGLGEEQAELIYSKLMHCIEKEKLFTEPELTLGSLAQKLNIHPNHLSQVINSYEEKNFYDFINYHRIEEFKRLAALPQNKKYTLLSLAYECGFNSKTSFNRNFKKVTGHSPSEFLLQANIQLV